MKIQFTCWRLASYYYAFGEFEKTEEGFYFSKGASVVVDENGIKANHFDGKFFKIEENIIRRLK